MNSTIKARHEMQQKPAVPKRVAARAANVSSQVILEGVRSGEHPTVRLGRRELILSAPFLAKIGVEG